MLRVWAMALLLAATPAVTQELSREDELSALRSQIERLQTRLARLGHERQSLSADLSRLEIELELQEVRVREAQTERRLASEELLGLEAQVAELEDRLETARTALRAVLIRLYRTGDQSFLRLYLSLESGDSLLPGVRQLRFLARQDAAAVERYAEMFAALSAREEAARTKAVQIQGWLDSEAARRDELAALRSRQTRLLARLEQEHRQVAVRTSRLLVRERKLQELITLLTGGLTSMPEGASIERFRGVLDWPVSGRVTRGFGPRLDPQYGTQVPHNGLELTTGEPSSVRSIYSGQVLYAAPLEGYGLTVILLHPGRVFSLYAGLERLGVAQGDVLSLGQVVGTIGGFLYFEIRVENHPEDPTSWLR